MKIKKSILFLLLCVAALSSCIQHRNLTFTDTDKLQTYNIDITSSFDTIIATNNFDIQYSVGPEVSVTLHTPKENRGNVKIYVNDNTLNLTLEKHSHTSPFKHNEALLVTITAPAVSEIIATNNCNISISGKYKVDRLSVNATNNADIEFNDIVSATNTSANAVNNAEISISSISAHILGAIAANNAEININRANIKSITATATNNANISLNGNCDSATLSAANNAEIDAGKLIAKQAVCSAANLASITANSKNMTSKPSNRSTITNKAK